MRTQFRLASSGLALLGFLVSGYLALFELGVSQEIFCPIGACEEVNASPYIYMLGVPLAVLGVVVYLLILALNLVGLRWGGEEITLLLFLLSLLGVAFSAYLTYLELFVLKAICSWCAVSAITMTAICILSGWELIRALRFPSKA